MTVSVINPFLSGPKIFFTGYDFGANGAVYSATAYDKLGNVYYGGRLGTAGSAYGINLFVIKIDAKGQYQWALQTNSTGSVFCSLDDMVTDPANNDLYICGRYGSANPGGFYIAKFPTNYNPLNSASWQRTFAGPINIPNFYNQADHVQQNPSARMTIDSTGTYLTMLYHGASSTVSNTFIARFYTGNGMFSSQYAVQSPSFSSQSSQIAGITTSKYSSSLDRVFISGSAGTFNGLTGRSVWVAALSGTTTLTVLSAVSLSPPSNQYLFGGDIAFDNQSGNLHITGNYGVTSSFTNAAVFWSQHSTDPSLSTTFVNRLYGNNSTNNIVAHSIAIANQPSNTFAYISGYDLGGNGAHLSQLSYDGTNASINATLIVNTGLTITRTGSLVQPILIRTRSDNTYIYSCGYWYNKPNAHAIKMPVNLLSPRYSTYRPANNVYGTTSAVINFNVNTAQYSLSTPSFSSAALTLTLATTTFTIGTGPFVYQPLTGVASNLNIYTISSV